MGGRDIAHEENPGRDRWIAQRIHRTPLQSQNTMLEHKNTQARKTITYIVWRSRHPDPIIISRHHQPIVYQSRFQPSEQHQETYLQVQYELSMQQMVYPTISRL